MVYYTANEAESSDQLVMPFWRRHQFWVDRQFEDDIARRKGILEAQMEGQTPDQAHRIISSKTATICARMAA